MSDEFIKDYIVARGDVTKPQPPHGAKQKPPRAAPAQVVEDDKEGESEGEGDDDENSSGLVHSADDDRTEVKKMFSALFRKLNLLYLNHQLIVPSRAQSKNADVPLVGAPRPALEMACSAHRLACRRTLSFRNSQGR